MTGMWLWIAPLIKNSVRARWHILVLWTGRRPSQQIRQEGNSQYLGMCHGFETSQFGNEGGQGRHGPLGSHKHGTGRYIILSTKPNQRKVALGQVHGISCLPRTHDKAQDDIGQLTRTVAGQTLVHRARSNGKQLVLGKGSRLLKGYTRMTGIGIGVHGVQRNPNGPRGVVIPGIRRLPPPCEQGLGQGTARFFQHQGSSYRKMQPGLSRRIQGREWLTGNGRLQVDAGTNFGPHRLGSDTSRVGSFAGDQVAGTCP